MNRTLIENWNAKVGPQDTVIVVGDVALGKVKESLENVRELNGDKYLVPGNHDKCWMGHKKIRASDAEMYREVGFTILPGEFMSPAPPFNIKICHFPTMGDTYTDDRYPEFRPTLGPNEWLIHGHVHNLWKINGHQINVGVDVWDFYPVSAEDIMLALHE